MTCLMTGPFLTHMHVCCAGVTYAAEPMAFVKPEDISGVKEAGWSAGNAFKAG